MAPSEFAIRLQKGIAGGFAPPLPSALYTITAQPGTTLLVQAQTREDGTPELSAPLAPKEVEKSSAESKIDELVSILKSLPTESPPGSQDIYGLDTSIAFLSDGLEWWNGGPQGCGGGESQVQATEEEKEKFKRAVEIVESLV